MKSGLKYLSAVLFMALWISDSIGQVNNYLYGSLSDEEIDLKICDYDKNADAVVLFDIGKTWFVPLGTGFELMYERTCRIKILKESGVNYANKIIPLYNHDKIYEKIQKIEGNSWNMIDGKLVASALSEASIYTSRENEKWTSMRFAMPEVSEGTIFEFHFIIRSNYLMHLRDWDFQSDIPVNYSRFEASMIPFYEYMFLLQGNYKNIEKNEFIAPGSERAIQDVKFRDKVYQFTLRNIPAFRETEFITSKEDYITKVNFQLSKYTMIDGSSVDVLTTWPRMIKDLLGYESFGRYIKRTVAQAEKIINTDSISSLDETARLNAVINTLKDRFNYNGVKSRYASGTVQDLLKKKSGNSGDINLLGIGLLQAVGVDAFPVIMSTRDHGRIRYDYPYSQFFNYVVIGVRINDKTFLADGTEPLLSSYKLPPRCINDKGLVVREDEVTWLDLSQKDVSMVLTTFETKLSDDGMLSNSTVLITSISYEALKIKKEFGDDKNKILTYLRQKDYLVNEADLRCVNYKSHSSPYSISFIASLENISSGNQFFVSPFLNQPIKENPLKEEERKIDIDFVYPLTQKFESRIEIPLGYTVTYIPEKLSTENENFRFSYNSEIEDSVLTIKASYTFIKGVYPASEYKSIQSNYEEIIKKLNDKIVIRKIG
ncbi:MAG: transglutaminase domain-containing protein [Bacteroidales bacterium]|nr:transglutaminase domain-containing protein [Bacteroidales bacterium]